MGYKKRFFESLAYEFKASQFLVEVSANADVKLSAPLTSAETSLVEQTSRTERRT